MKKIILTLAIATSSLLAFAGNKNENVSKQALDAFNREFTTAQEVKWTEGTEYYKASFILNDQYIAAYYNEQGELLGLMRNMSVLNLPLKLQTKVRSEYSEYWISDLFEYSDDEGTHYYITLEKADSKLVLKSKDSTEWSLFRKTTKL
jgi:hypothetical protein